MKKNGPDRSRRQQELRRRRDERAFLFDVSLSRCVAEVGREDWERAIRASGGGVSAAAAECGVLGVPRGAKVLWGRSAEEAVAIYRRWQKQRRKG
jgi:hypothetical protein